MSGLGLNLELIALEEIAKRPAYLGAKVSLGLKTNWSAGWVAGLELVTEVGPPTKFVGFGKTPQTAVRALYDELAPGLAVEGIIRWLRQE